MVKISIYLGEHTAEYSKSIAIVSGKILQSVLQHFFHQVLQLLNANLPILLTSLLKSTKTGKLYTHFCDAECHFLQQSCTYLSVYLFVRCHFMANKHVHYYGTVLPRRRPHHVLILSVCLSVRLSVPCLHLEGKRKGLRIPNLVGRIRGTRAPRGPISRSRGQRSRSRRLIALLSLPSLCLLFTVYIESLTEP